MIRSIVVVLGVLLICVFSETFITSVSHFQWQSNPTYAGVWEGTFDKLVSLCSYDWLYDYDYRSMADSLTAGVSTNEEKAERIYRYLTENLTYSLEDWDLAPAECLRQGKGVCRTISLAFVKLAGAAGIEAHPVIGYICSPERIDCNHQWVIWKDEKGWQLGDPTWDLGRKKFQYYKIDPNVLIKSHYPICRSHQLLDDPLTFDQWEVLSTSELAVSTPPISNPLDRLLEKIRWIGEYFKEFRINFV